MMTGSSWIAENVQT